MENQPNILWISMLAKLSIWSYERSEIRSEIALSISSGKTTRCFGRPVVGIRVRLGLDSCVLFVFTLRPERTRISFPTRIRKRITWFSRTVSGKINEGNQIVIVDVDNMKINNTLVHNQNISKKRSSFAFIHVLYIRVYIVCTQISVIKVVT